MDKDVWKDGVLNIARRVADESYQRSAWFGIGNRVSSPEELYCELFDDYIFDDFLESPDIGLTEHQRLLGLKLGDSLRKYADEIEFLDDPAKVIDDPDWAVVRHAAREFVDAF